MNIIQPIKVVSSENDIKYSNDKYSGNIFSSTEKNEDRQREILLNHDVLVLLMEKLSLQTLLNLGRVCFQWYMARNFVLYSKKYLCLANKVETQCLQSCFDGNKICISSSMHRFFQIDHKDFDLTFTIVNQTYSNENSDKLTDIEMEVEERPSLAQVLVDQLPRIDRLTIFMYELSISDLLKLISSWSGQLIELKLILNNDNDHIGIHDWEQIFIVISSMTKLKHLSLLVRNNHLDQQNQLQSLDFNLLAPAIERLEEFYLGFDNYNSENRRTVFIDLLRALNPTRLKHWGLGFFNYDESFYQAPLYWSVSDIITYTVEYFERRAPQLLNCMDRVKLYYRPWQFNPSHLNTDSFPEFGQFSHYYDSMRFLEVTLFCSRIEERFIATLVNFSKLDTLILNYHYEVSGDEKFGLHPSSPIDRYQIVPNVKRLFIQRTLAHSSMLPKIFVNAKIIPY